MNLANVLPTTSVRQATILAVDDTPDNLSLINGVLRDHYKVKVAASGEQALRIVAGNAPPDLILLDVMMPGMNGYEVCRQLKANPATADIPVIFVTAVDTVEGEAEGFAAGGVDYLTKPFNPLLMKARIATQLALRQSLQRLAQANDQLEHERELVAGTVACMRQTQAFNHTGLRALVAPVEDSNGDILLSALTPDGRRWVGVGDVTGHGLQAAIACPLVSLVFYRAAKAGWPATRLLAELNTVLVELLPTGTYLAFVLAEVSADNRMCSVWNAGVPESLLRDAAGTLHAIPSASVPLGIVDEAALLPEGTALEVGPQHKLYVFTDGVTEARNAQGEQLGVDGVRRMLAHFVPDAQPLEAIDALVRQYRGDAPADDDFTFAELSFNGATDADT